MIKLIVSDVDGTLVEDGSADINPELFEVILKLREKGIQFAIASGRPWSSVEHTFDPVKKKIFYMHNNIYALYRLYTESSALSTQSKHTG